MLHVQKYLMSHTLKELIEQYDLKHRLYDDRVVLNYGIKSPKFDPIIKECRSLILSLVSKPKYEILSRSFDRFYKLNEGNDKDDFNWNNCTVFAKLDGSLISVYNDDQWRVATRGTGFAEGNLPLNNKTYYELFLEAIGCSLDSFCKKLNRNHTYIFELTSPENRIVTRYKDTSVTLLAIRNNYSGDYTDYSVIKYILNYIFPEKSNVQLPKTYDLNKPKDIVDFVEQMDQLDEGVVCYDNYSQTRIKIKNSVYDAIHHLRGNEATKKSIIKLILNGKTEEYFSSFPEDKKLFEPYIEQYKKLVKNVKIVYNKYKNIENQKEFALNIKDLPYSGFLFRLRKGDSLDKLFSRDNLDMILKQIKDN